MDHHSTSLMASNELNTSVAEFEDDLEPDLDISHGKDKVWLVKLPKWLIEHWSKVDQDNLDLARITIPTNTTATSGSDIKLVLPDTSMNADIPKEFTINMTNRKVTNTYVFSEKDINIKKEASSSTLPNGNNRYAPYPKIPPKATSIVGTVAHECTITPVMNASYSKTVKSRVQEANQPRRQVQIISEQNGIPSDSYLYNPSKNQPFGKFTGGTQRSKSESQHNKATRIPKNELLDLLFKCFQEYEYWSLKGLREYVKQPESYLREALEEIAHLNKRGPYALKWSLKPHYKQSQELSSGTRESVGGAKKEEDGFGTPPMKTEPDNGNNVKMEDVL